MKKQKGFTLIELLVVIAIIGLLSTIAIVAMGGARGKARDAKRISDIRQMSTILDVEAAANPGTAGVGVDITGCTAVKQMTSACTGPSDISVFPTLKEPTPQAPQVACATGGTKGCDYSIANGVGTAKPQTGDYQICFYLESTNNIGAGAATIKNIKTGGILTDGCTIP